MAEVVEEQLQKAREELQKHIPMSKYLADHKLGYDLGEQGKIRCPVHDDSSPSFFYDDDMGTGNCFGCGLKGTVLEIHYARMKEVNERYTQVKAIHDLARKYRVTVPNLYKREISRYGKTHMTPSKRKRGEMTEDIARIKVNKLTTSIRRLETVEQKMQCYTLLDNLWKGQETAINTYNEVMGLLKTFKEAQGRQGATNREG